MIKNIRSCLKVLLLVLAFSPPALAADEIGPLFYNSFSAGYLRAGVEDSASLFWQGYFDYDEYFLKLDLNLPFSGHKLAGLDSVVVERAEYDTGTSGIIYGPLTDQNLGQGLLMRSYSTLDKGLAILSNTDTALDVYYQGEIFDFEMFGAWSHLYGARLTEDFDVIEIGQSVVTDVDGVRVRDKSGREKELSGQTGIALDVLAPVFGDLDFYAEAASLGRAGQGYCAGLQYGYNLVAMDISVRLEARQCGAGFAPSYFGWGYDMNPVDLSSLEAFNKPRGGYFAELRSYVINFLSLNVAYEGYDDSNGAFYLDGWARIFPKLLLSAYLKQPSFAAYRSTSFYEGMLIGGSIRYDLSPNVFAKIEAKKGFDPLIGDVKESSFIEAGIVF